MNTGSPRLRQLELFPPVTNFKIPDSSAQKVFKPASESVGTAMTRNFDAGVPAQPESAKR